MTSDLGEIGFAGTCLVDDLTVKHDHETGQRVPEARRAADAVPGKYGTAKTRPQAGANVET
jgi:hypothetical protein